MKQHATQIFQAGIAVIVDVSTETGLWKLGKILREKTVADLNDSDHIIGICGAQTVYFMATVRKNIAFLQ